MKKLVLFSSLLLLISAVSVAQMNVYGASRYSTNATSNDWSFIVLGDGRQHIGTWNSSIGHYTHDNQTNPIREALIDKVVSNHSDLEFILHTGDIVANGAEQDDWDRYFEDIDGIIQNNISIYYAVGNHEYYRYAIGPNQYAPPQEDLATYLANVEMPGNERFYSFDFNDQIHFVIINSNEDMSGGLELTLEQEDWVINDLKTNKIDFVIAAYHHPSYSIRDSNRVQVARSVRAQLEPIFIEYNVDLVFSGHDHYYYRTLRNKIMYVTTGGAGSNLYTDGDRQDWQEGDVYFSNYHYCEVIVSNDDLNVNVYSFDEVDNSTILTDNFQIPLKDPIISSSTSSKSTTSASTITTNLNITPNIDSSEDASLNFGYNLTWILGLIVISLYENIRKKKNKN